MNIILTIVICGVVLVAGYKVGDIARRYFFKDEDEEES